MPNKKRVRVLTAVAGVKGTFDGAIYQELIELARAAKSTGLSLQLTANNSVPGEHRAAAASIYGAYANSVRHKDLELLPAALEYAEEIALNTTRA